MKTAEEILREKNRPMITVASDVTIHEAIQVMVKNNIGAVLVKENNKIVGIYTERDLLKNSNEEGFDPQSAIIKEYMMKDLIFVPHNAPIYELQDIMLDKFCRHLLIMKDTLFIGFISAGDVTRASLTQTEKLASVGTLVTEIAHEINNPIAGMQNCLRRMKANPENQEQNKTYLALMQEAVVRIEKIVRGLLDYARYEKIEFEDVDIHKIIDEALTLIAFRIERFNIKVENAMPVDLPLIPGSFNHLQQVFINIFINSATAIEEKCQESSHCARQIYIRANAGHDALDIQIEDTGSGIPASMKEKIFDPFYTTRKIGSGTGLGLFVCRNIVKIHKGEIRFESQSGEGTTFYIRLPLKR